MAERFWKESPGRGTEKCKELGWEWIYFLKIETIGSTTRTELDWTGKSALSLTVHGALPCTVPWRGLRILTNSQVVALKFYQASQSPEVVRGGVAKHADFPGRFSFTKSVMEPGISHCGSCPESRIQMSSFLTAPKNTALVTGPLIVEKSFQGVETSIFKNKKRKKKSKILLIERAFCLFQSHVYVLVWALGIECISY